MKKTVAILLALVTAISMLCLNAYVEEGGQPSTGENTVRAYTYDENNKHSPSIWLNTFDYDGECTGTDYVIFRCAAPLKAVGLPELYAGKSESDSACTVRFELFKWDANAEQTVTGTDLLAKEVYFDGDSKDLPYFTFEPALPAGQYLFRISQLTPESEEGGNPYAVLPIAEMKYADNKLEFGLRGPFVFFIECEKAEGVLDYFLNLEGKESAIEILPEKTVIPRAPEGVHPFHEYGIVTPKVPEGQVLYSLALIEAPTWRNKNGDSDVAFDVFKWTGDYGQSVSGKSICSGEIFDHQDNSNLTLKFGAALRYGHRYLIVLYRANDGAIGYYEGVSDSVEDWEFYEYGEELDYYPAMKTAYANVGDLGPEPTEEPTEEPTAVPETTPVSEPEPTAVSSDSTSKPEADPTEEPATEPGKDKGCGGFAGSDSIILLACATVIVLRRRRTVSREQ